MRGLRIIAVFVLVSGVCFADRAFSDEPRVRNCPAVISIKIEGERQDRGALSAASSLIAAELRDALTGGLPRARVFTWADDRNAIREEGELQAEEAAKFGRDEGGRRAAERQDKFVGSLGTASDFVIVVNLGSLGEQYVLNVGVFHNEPWAQLFRLQRTFGDIGGDLSGVASGVGAEIADRLKDGFYCVSAEPEELRAKGKEADLKARVVNLVNEPVEDEVVKFKTAKPEVGVAEPEKVALKGGEADTRYIVYKEKPNVVKIMVKPKEPNCRRFITNGLNVPVKVNFVLEFSGYSQANVNISEEGVSFNAAYKTIISEGRIPLEIDAEKGTVTGTGFCYIENSNEGMFFGPGVTGGDRGGAEKEKVVAEVKGDVRAEGQVLELVVRLEGRNQPYQNSLEAHSEEGASSIGASITDDRVVYNPITVTDSEGVHELGPRSYRLKDKEKSGVLARIFVSMYDGAKTPFKKDLPNNPGPGITQHLDYEFVLKEEEE